jgi:hypothetical protein
MRTLATETFVGLGLLAETAATGHAQYYNYYGARNTYTWSPYNYPGAPDQPPRATHGIIIIRGMGRTTPVRRPAVTAVRSLDYRRMIARAGRWLAARPKCEHPLHWAGVLRYS